MFFIFTLVAFELLASFAFGASFLDSAGSPISILPGTDPDPCPEPRPYLDVRDDAPKAKIRQKQKGKKFIEALTVCVGYADFLTWTLPFTRALFDRLVVVTTPADVQTQAICEYWHVETVLTNAFFESGAKFNKAKGINEGLKRLSRTGWIVHFDSDIYLPPRTREILDLLPLDAQGIYSVDRLNCNSFEDWIGYLENPESQHGRDGLLLSSRFDRGARLLDLDRDGYIPIGYFQMWRPSASNIHTYPDRTDGAEHTDALHAFQWARGDRHLIPEIVAIHLDSERHQKMGINWRGRKSAPFKLK